MARAERSESIAEKSMKFLISGMQTAFQIAVKILGSLVILMSFGGCILWPVNKKDVIGNYQSVLEDGTSGLPDGGSEILELKADGTCDQNIVLKDGRTFVAQGTWEWHQDYKWVIVKNVYAPVDNMTDQIDPNLEKTIGKIVQSYPAWRSFTGRITLGSDEGVHYEKK